MSKNRLNIGKEFISILLPFKIKLKVNYKKIYFMIL